MRHRPSPAVAVFCNSELMMSALRSTSISSSTLGWAWWKSPRNSSYNAECTRLMVNSLTLPTTASLRCSTAALMRDTSA
ncbi:hypothetical protein D3C80_2098260 [compost metagenome]